MELVPDTPIEPIEFQIRIRDFDLNLLPIDRGLLESNPKLLQDAVMTFFSEYFARAGGRATIAASDETVTLAWAPDSLNDKDALIAYTTQLLNRGCYSQVEPILRKLAEKFPNEFVIHHNLGMMLSNQGRLPEAITVLRRSVELSPENADAWIALGVALDRHGDHPAGVAAMAKAVGLAPNNPHALMNMGGLLARTDPQQALGYFKGALGFDPENQLVWYNYAQCLIGLKLADEADTALGRVIQLAPYTELASRAEDKRRQLASMRLQSGGPRQDVIQFCAEAIRFYAKAEAKLAKSVLYEIALLGKQGLDVNDRQPRYELKSLPGCYSGAHLLAYLYVGLKRMDPTIDPGVDFGREYAAAQKLVQE